MKRFIRVTLALALLGPVTMLAGCNKVPFAKTGAVVAGVVRIAKTELDGLLAQQKITQDAHDKAARKVDALGQNVTAYTNLIAGFPTINKQNAVAILDATKALVEQVRATVTDPDLVAIGPGSKTVQYLNYAVSIAEASRDAVAILFPPPPAPGAAAAAASSIAPAPIAASKIIVQLPPKPPGL